MLFAGGFRWLRGHSHQPPLVFLPLDADQPSPARMLLDRAWFWLRVHVIGKGKTIVVRATVFEPMDRGVRPFDLPPVGAESNRVQLWTLTAEGLEQVKRQLAERRLNP